MNQQNLFKTAEIKKHVRPFGFQLVLDTLKSKGHEYRALKPSDTGGTILMSLYWMEDLYEFIRWRKRNNIGKNFNVILGGNHAMCYPQSVVSFADGAFVGDGELWDGISTENIVMLNDHPKKIGINPHIPNHVIKLENKSTTTGKTVDIVELTRGCRNMCHFCQYAWSKPFRTNDADFLLQTISEVNGKTIRLVSADGHQHPKINEIERACEVNRTRNVSQDNSLLEIRKVLNDLTEVRGTQRFGIDGMSERLRRKMHKPIGTQELIDLVFELYQRGARRFLAYNLFGVPGETKEDFEEYNETLKQIADKINAPCAFVTCWNAFMPCSLTPLQWEASSWGKDTRDTKELLKTMEYGEKKKVKLFHMPMKTGNHKITLRVLALRSSPASANLVYNVALKGNMTERQILKEFERNEGFHLHSERPLDSKLPWDDFLIYDRNRLESLAEKHRKWQNANMST